MDPGFPLDEGSDSDAVNFDVRPTDGCEDAK